jgi:hypothetical protein
MPVAGAAASPYPAGRRIRRDVVNIDAGVVYNDRPTVSRARYFDDDMDL